MASQLPPIPQGTLENPNVQIIQIKRKRKDPPIDSLYLEQQLETEDDTQISPNRPKILARKLRRTQFMYQRIDPNEIALFDSPPPDLASSQPEPLQATALRKRPRPRRWVASQTLDSGPEGQRTFVLKKNENAEELDVVGNPDIATNDEVDTLEDFVWDILVQTKINDMDPSFGGGVLAVPLEGVNTARLVLNANDETELFGEIYGSDEEDEDRVETDNEDENAEDYYAADYPEEEDEEDEEHDDDEDDDDDDDGRGYYYGSDDEEYGGAGFYNEETGRFSKTQYLNTHTDETTSMHH